MTDRYFPTHAQYEQLIRESGGDVIKFDLLGLVNHKDLRYLEVEDCYEYQYDEERQTLRIFKR